MRGRTSRCQVTDDACWVADSDHVGGEVARDDGSRSDHAVLADGDAGTDDDAATKPDVVTDADGLRRLPPVPPWAGFERMGCSSSGVTSIAAPSRVLERLT